MLGLRGYGQTDPCTWGSPFSVRARGGGRFFCGDDELAAGGCARDDEVRGGADPVLVGMGTGSLCVEWTKGGPLCGASWLGADGFHFPFFSPCGVGGGARHPDVLLAPADVRALAVPKQH